MHLSERQKQIISTSIKLIANQGIQTLTIKNIASKIGVSEPAIYRHFDSKKDILIAILDYFEDVTGNIKDQFFNPKLSGMQKLEAFISHRYDIFTGDPDLAKVLFNEDIFLNDELLGMKIMQIMSGHRELLIMAIRQGQSEGSIRSNTGEDQLFYIIIGSMRLLVNRWCHSDFSFHLKTEGIALWNTIKTIIR